MRRLDKIAASYDAIKSGPDLIAALLDAGIWSQADLAKASRLGGPTITDLKLGRRRPTGADRAALYWAIATRVIRE